MDIPEPPKTAPELDIMLLNEVQVLLSEKRTALSTMRTGIAIFAFPLSVLSVLIVTSQSYHLREVLHWFVPLLIINVGLIALAIHLIVHSFRRIHHYDRIIAELKHKHSRLMEFLD